MNIPRDDNRVPLMLVPATTALEQTEDTTISAATSLTLKTATQLLEVSAIGGGVYMKYGATTITSSNFDEFIQSGHTRHYAVPTGVTVVQFIQRDSGAAVIVIEK